MVHGVHSQIDRQSVNGPRLPFPLTEGLSSLASFEIDAGLREAIRNRIRKNDMKLFASQEASGRQLDPKSVGWSGFNSKNFRFRLRQDPGSKNALGRIKFMFPNHFNVYPKNKALL
jgi:hypothetical protein